MDTANSSSANDQQLKSIGEQKRIAQLEHKIASVSKQLDEKGTKLKEALEQNASLKDRIGTLEQEKLEVSLLIETLTKSRDRLLQEKTDLRNELLGLEKRKDQLELQVAKLNSEKHRHLEDISELRQKCDELWGERTELQSQIDDFQSDKALIVQPIRKEWNGPKVVQHQKKMKKKCKIPKISGPIGNMPLPTLASVCAKFNDDGATNPLLADNVGTIEIDDDGAADANVAVVRPPMSKSAKRALRRSRKQAFWKKQNNCLSTQQTNNEIKKEEKTESPIDYDKEQWKREKDILLASKQWYMDEIADREKKINELIQAKSDGARNLLDCQNECHALRLAADRTRHEADVQARLMHAKEAQVDQLQQRVHQCAHERDETEARAAQYARAHDELLQQTEQLQAEHRQAAEAWERETQRQLDEQRAKIVGELGAQNAAELNRVQTEANNAQMRLTEMLKKAAETHRKLEDERNQLFEKHKLLEDNLEAYKRRFVAQLQRAMDTRCSQMGKGLRNAFADIVGQMDSDTAASTTARPLPLADQFANDHENDDDCSVLIGFDSSSPRRGNGSADLFNSSALFGQCDGNNAIKNKSGANKSRTSNTRTTTTPCPTKLTDTTKRGGGASTSTAAANVNNKTGTTINSSRGPAMLALLTTPSATAKVAKQRQQQQKRQQQHQEAVEAVDKENRRPPQSPQHQQQQRHGPSSSTMMNSNAITAASSVPQQQQQRKRPPTVANNASSPRLSSSSSSLLFSGFLPPPLPPPQQQQHSPAHGSTVVANKRKPLSNASAIGGIASLKVSTGTEQSQRNPTATTRTSTAAATGRNVRQKQQQTAPSSTLLLSPRRAVPSSSAAGTSAKQQQQNMKFPAFRL
ncbi:hypothetical protein niasHT_037823 [Heterodera trifolii]|uniref:Uncharacterized protein n=1 Tax=Heterodera trifolii TaxID=157864 RepID=A0ABD2IXY9_9BILA